MPVSKLKHRRRLASPSRTKVTHPNNSKSSSNSSNASVKWSILILFICLLASAKYFGGDESNGVDVSPQLLEDSSVSSNARSNEPEPVLATTKKTTICSIQIPLDLSDTATWHTPYTPSYFEHEPPQAKKHAVIIKNEPIPQYDNADDKYRIVSDLFAAMDLAYEKQCDLYITKDADWFWDIFVTLFFETHFASFEKNDQFWNKMQDSLGVKIVSNYDEAMRLFGEETALTVVTANYQLESSTLTATQVRNRRDTVFRMIFRTSPQSHNELGDICYPIELNGLYNGGSFFTVLSPCMSKESQSKFNEVTGRSQPSMTLKYADSVVEKLGITRDKGFTIIKGDGSGKEPEETKGIPKHGLIINVSETDDYEEHEMLYLALLAKVFVADPSHWSLMIARMRYALGMSNTYVLRSDSVNDDNYLELYDRNLGIWMG